MRLWPEVEGPGDHPKADPAECRGARGELEIEEREAQGLCESYIRNFPTSKEEQTVNEADVYF